jgi:hypothetical protein
MIALLCLFPVRLAVQAEERLGYARCWIEQIVNERRHSAPSLQNRIVAWSSSPRILGGETFWLGVPLALLVAVAVSLPRKHPHADVRYGVALISLVYLWRDEPHSAAATAQAALFASFTAFWTILALHLQDLRIGPAQRSLSVQPTHPLSSLRCVQTAPCESGSSADLLEGCSPLHCFGWTATRSESTNGH